MNLSLSGKGLIAVAILFATTIVSRPLQAGHCDDSSCCETSSKCCPKCNYCCRLDAEEVEVEKSCFEVECDVVCIPRVVFPWQTGHGCFPWSKKKCSSCDACDGGGCKSCTNCVHNGAKIRTVKKLKSKKYTCPGCEYSWTPERTGCGNGCGSCDAGWDSSETTLPEAPPAVPMSDAQVRSKPQTYPAPYSYGLTTVEVE